MTRLTLTAALCASAAFPAFATELEVTHWWTSGGEANAVSKLAEAWTASGNAWLDGAIAGGGDVARPVMISRILGGDPMDAFQFNHGRQAEELIEAGLLLDLTDVAEANNWRGIVNPPSLLDACTYEGRIYCAPINIHSWQWMWLNNQVYADLGLPVPTNWDEFVASAQAVRDAGKVPLAMGGQPWQASGAFGVMTVALAGTDAWLAVNRDKDEAVAAGPDYQRVFEAAAAARELARGTNVLDWNLATAMVINGDAAGQIMGDWAQGEFAMAGKTAGADYTCLPGLGVNKILRSDGGAEGAGRADAVAGGAGQLQPGQGVTAGARGRRPVGGQRLHEAGAGDPCLGQHPALGRHPAVAGHRAAGQRPDDRVLGQRDAGGRRAGALRRDHRQCRVMPSAGVPQGAPVPPMPPGRPVSATLRPRSRRCR
jgi:glucose/mannose transport system substrate-binding protein